MPSAHKECKARAVKTALTELRHLCSVDSAAVSITGKARPTVQQTPHWLIRAGSFHISKKTLQYFILLERMDIVSSAWPSPWVIFLLVCHSPSSICCAASSVFTLWCFKTFVFIFCFPPRIRLIFLHVLFISGQSIFFSSFFFYFSFCSQCISCSSFSTTLLVLC